MTRRTWLLAGTFVAVTAVVGGLIVTSSAQLAATTAQNTPSSTATVERGPLEAEVSVNGTLTYRTGPDGSPYSVINQAQGTYTKLPDQGQRVDCGGELYRVDDKPVLLLCGTLPAYRNLKVGDTGQDVLELNRNLHDLRVDALAGTAVDPAANQFTSQTERALKQLQRDKGFPVTGELAFGDATFLPQTLLVSKVSGALGGAARPGAPVLSATSDTPEVQYAIDPSEQAGIVEGARAQITLPDNTSLTGKVSGFSAATQAPVGQGGEPGATTIPAYISLDTPDKARKFADAAVKVLITTKGVQDVLSVPVTAIVANAGGGFAVEVVRNDGRRDLVVVKLGLFDSSAGRVQVDGELRVGDRVLVPSL